MGNHFAIPGMVGPETPGAGDIARLRDSDVLECDGRREDFMVVD